MAPGQTPATLNPTQRHQIQRNQQGSAPHIEALRHFLISKGYHISDMGGTVGKLMRSALADWHSGVGSRDAHAWDQAHNRPNQMFDRPSGNHLPQDGQGHPYMPQPTRHVVQAAQRPHGPAGGPHPHPSGPAPHQGRGNGGGGGGNGGADFTSMLTGLLGQSGTSHMIPNSLADEMAGVSDAQAATFQDQLDHLPAAKKAALKNISDWYGQVGTSEKTAAGRDASIAGAGQKSVADAAKGIIASLGGDANAGAGEIGAVGANDANTLAAMGANDKMLSSDLAPIFALAEAGAKNSRSQQYSQAQSDLQDSRAQAKGQGQTDRANALMAILQANNGSRQTDFQNQAGLLNTLASLQISGVNAQSQAQSRAIENAYRMSEIQKNGQKSQGGLEAMTPVQRADFVQKIVSGLKDPNSGKLSLAWPDALRAARNSVRSAGLNPMNKQVINSIIGPALSNAGITGQGGGFWPAIYQP